MTDYTFVPERWDVGLWDQAHWDGQLGFNAEQTSVVITPQDATLTATITTNNFLLTADTVTVWIAPQEANFYITWAPFPQTGAIHLGIPKYFVDRW